MDEEDIKVAAGVCSGVARDKTLCLSDEERKLLKDAAALLKEC